MEPATASARPRPGLICAWCGWPVQVRQNEGIALSAIGPIGCAWLCRAAICVKGREARRPITDHLLQLSGLPPS